MRNKNELARKTAFRAELKRQEIRKQKFKQHATGFADVFAVITAAILASSIVSLILWGIGFIALSYSIVLLAGAVTFSISFLISYLIGSHQRALGLSIGLSILALLTFATTLTLLFTTNLAAIAILGIPAAPIVFGFVLFAVFVVGVVMSRMAPATFDAGNAPQPAQPSPPDTQNSHSSILEAKPPVLDAKVVQAQTKQMSPREMQAIFEKTGITEIHYERGVFEIRAKIEDHAQIKATNLQFRDNFEDIQQFFQSQQSRNRETGKFLGDNLTFQDLIALVQAPNSPFDQARKHRPFKVSNTESVAQSVVQDRVKDEIAIFAKTTISKVFYDKTHNIFGISFLKKNGADDRLFFPCDFEAFSDAFEEAQQKGYIDTNLPIQDFLKLSKSKPFQDAVSKPLVEIEIPVELQSPYIKSSKVQTVDSGQKEGSLAQLPAAAESDQSSASSKEKKEEKGGLALQKAEGLIEEIQIEPLDNKGKNFVFETNGRQYFSGNPEAFFGVLQREGIIDETLSFESLKDKIVQKFDQAKPPQAQGPKEASKSALQAQFIPGITIIQPAPQADADKPQSNAGVNPSQPAFSPPPLEEEAAPSSSPKPGQRSGEKE